MPRAFLVKKSSSINSSISLSLPNHKAGYPDKKTTAADGQKQGDLPWESLDMSEYEKELQTAQTVELELDYQRYTNRRTPSPQGEVSRQGITLKAEKYLSADSEETDRRIPLFYSPSSKSNFHEVSYTEEDVEKPFECRHCIISFARLNDLQSHMELHSIKKPFNCTDMHRTFDERLIENQLKTNHSIKMMHRPSTSDFKFHSPEKPFKCENEIDKIAMDNPDHFIEKPFDFNRRMFFPRTNSDLQHNSYPRTYANYFEERETRTQADSEKEISTEKPFKCRECDISFGQVNDLQRHYETHSCKKSPTNDIDIDVTSDMESVTSEESQNEKPFKCNHCVMSFTRPSDLQRHLLIHSNNKPYRCEKCDREFTWFGNFQKHILSHMSDNQSQSAGSYSAMFTLLAREQVKDLFIKEGDKYRCRLCSKDFTRLSGLKTHIRMHTGERPYVCEVCSFAFTTSRALKMHTRLHTGEKPYKCDVCDRAFTRRDEMHTHMYIHKGEKPFKCTECSASFIRYGHLQRHLLIHSDDKPYKCKLCPKSFTQYRNLQTHTYKHTGERPYKCKYCPKGFTQYGTLQAHERTHTGEKPFKCQLCEKAFITSSHLRWHIKTQHPKNQSE